MDDLAETRATYEAVADEYYERHADRGNVLGFLNRYLDVLDGDRVLDAGCGPGWESRAMTAEGLDVIGIDLSDAFLSIADEEAPAADFARMDMRRLGLDGNAFDGIWACASFLHVPREDAPPTLREFRRTLRRGGALFVAVKRGRGTTMGGSYDVDEREFTLYEADDLRCLLEAAGFAIEHLETDEGWVRAYASAE